MATPVVVIDRLTMSYAYGNMVMKCRKTGVANHIVRNVLRAKSKISRERHRDDRKERPRAIIGTDPPDQ